MNKYNKSKSLSTEDLIRIRDYVFAPKKETVENTFLFVDKAVDFNCFLSFLEGEKTLEELYESQGEMLLTFDLINKKINFDRPRNKTKISRFNKNKR